MTASWGELRGILAATERARPVVVCHPDDLDQVTEAVDLLRRSPAPREIPRVMANKWAERGQLIIIRNPDLLLA